MHVSNLDVRVRWLALQVAVEVLMGTEGKPSARRFVVEVGEQIQLVDAIKLVHPHTDEVALFSSPSSGLAINARMAS